MGKIVDRIEASTERASDAYHNSALGKTIETVASTTSDVVEVAGQAVVLSLSKAWIGIGLMNPATTDDAERFKTSDWLKKTQTGGPEVNSKSGPNLDRFNYKQLYSLQIGDFFMPLSQTFVLRAKKRLNISALVDGPDIIQQTRKEAKTIDCTLRITLRDNQPNLQIIEAKQDSTRGGASPEFEVATLARFLAEFYEKDAIFAIQNETINDTFGVQYVFISEYRFTPRTGMGTYIFEFSLTEVKYGENAITFNLREIDADAGTY